MLERPGGDWRLDVAPTGIEEPLPLPVVPDWAEQVNKATGLTRLIDRHLNYEEKLRRMLPDERLSPIGLCPEQRFSLLTDLLAVTPPDRKET